MMLGLTVVRRATVEAREARLRIPSTLELRRLTRLRQVFVLTSSILRATRTRRRVTVATSRSTGRHTLTTRIESNTGTGVSTGLTKSLERLIVFDEGADILVRELGILDTTQTASNSILHILSKRREVYGSH